MTDQTTPERQIQSHFVRAGRQGGHRRDWSLCVFFRVMSEVEVRASITRLLGERPDAATPDMFQEMPPDAPPEDMIATREGGAQQRAPRPAPAPARKLRRAAVEADAAPLPGARLAMELANPTLWTPFASEDGESLPIVSRAAPAKFFLDWLKAVIGADRTALLDELTALASQFERQSVGSGMSGADQQVMRSVLDASLLKLGTGFSGLAAMVAALGADEAEDHGLKILRQGLVSVCAYELIRHVRRALSGVPVLRAAADEIRYTKTASAFAGDRSPIEIAFTFQGLSALAIDPKVLASFPDVFKEGMAARAGRLGDVGESAPSHWSGELGQSAIHGLLSGGFAIKGAREADWTTLRRQIHLFNEAGPGEGKALRMALGLVFRAIGLEIVHIELGQDPYHVGANGEIIKPKHRHEHFGFRDGISQPFLGLDLGDPIAGSATPSRNGSWTPVAPGEIFLGLADEDGGVQIAPAHTELRDGGTYLVFRKLEQDVGGLRTYLAGARPGSNQAQKRLAANFVGRWKNGVSLVQAPAAAPDFDDAGEADLNNFRYAQSDPTGRKCPLGAHVRRTNPRDIGGQNQARRNRIQRRGIAYGGPFLAEGSIGDGRERGMLFIALNARIDQQFELIQSRWINGGEFLGQAGLGKCPITGANNGAAGDQFLANDSPSPVRGLPAFVHTRGGDYFYAPGLKGISAIAYQRIKAPNLSTPNQVGHGGVKTPDVFSPDNIRRLVKHTLAVGPLSESFEPLEAPGAHVEDATTGQPIVFVGQHAQVTEILSAGANVGVRHCTSASQRMMAGAQLLIGTETGDTVLRAPMKEVLEQAWRLLNPRQRLDAALDEALANAVRRTRKVGRIDLVQDLAVDPIYRVIADIYGVRGPNYLTELAVALPFARQHVSELHPDWLAMLAGRAPDNPRMATLQVWSILMFSDLIGNLRMQEELKLLSMQAGAEFSVYLEQLLMKERARPKKQRGAINTLVEAFRALEGGTFAGKKLEGDEYYRIVRLLLTELVPSALAVIPATFGSLMSALLAHRINLSYLVEYLEKIDPANGLKGLIYETNRLNPSLPVLQRYAESNIVLADGTKIAKGNWLGVLIAAANLDPTAFPEPSKFSPHPSLGGPPRDVSKYLMFGVGPHRACWGRDRLAMLALEKCVRTAARLPGLRRLAGAGGAPIQLIRSMIGLPARFARH